MLHRMERLHGMIIGATDGELGKVKDVYFDDHAWGVRYLVVDTGSWLEDRKVLISPIAVAGIDWEQRIVKVGLSRQQVKDSPHIDTDKPVSRQHEMEFFGYYGYPDYWASPMLWSDTAYTLLAPPGALAVDKEAVAQAERRRAAADPHLRSAAEVAGYHLQATDDSIDHVEDFMVDDETWAIRYIVVDTRNWWPGKHVLIPPHWITRVEWSENLVFVDVARTAVETSPQYDPAAVFSREYEASLYRHYQRPAYWRD